MVKFRSTSGDQNSMSIQRLVNVDVDGEVNPIFILNQNSTFDVILTRFLCWAGFASECKASQINAILFFSKEQFHERTVVLQENSKYLQTNARFLIRTQQVCR